jgi:DNA replication and repair protein RecF
VHLVSLAITDFRNIRSASIAPAPTGTTVITGRNGTGKTSILEAVAYLATLQSFRGSPREALVRSGTDAAVLRARTQVGDRPVDIEAEVQSGGRSRTMVNRQPVRRRVDLHDALRTTVFSPEDIGVVRGGPPSDAGSSTRPWR